MHSLNRDFWRGRSVAVTGHTGFKGSWMSLWLQSMGAEVHGLALAPPTRPSLFNEARIDQGMRSTLGDVRNYGTVHAFVQTCRPDIIFHMAAQPLVRHSYQEPIETYATNVMGTVHILEAARTTACARAVVVVTTDKCYENKEWLWGYREDEPMGGADPYSSSKGCAELVTNAYRRSFFLNSSLALASARAGNVIGGGDWARDRLIPDILRAFESSRPVRVRNPNSTRPWQHVLDPLSGYLILAERLFYGGQDFTEAWNFGPLDADVRPVISIVEQMARFWGPDASWATDDGDHPHEARFLKLDVSKARSRLAWQPRWGLDKALEKICDWHRAWLSGADVRAKCLEQIDEYQKVSA